MRSSCCQLSVSSPLQTAGPSRVLQAEGGMREACCQPPPSLLPSCQSHTFPHTRPYTLADTLSCLLSLTHTLLPDAHSSVLFLSLLLPNTHTCLPTTLCTQPGPPPPGRPVEPGLAPPALPPVPSYPTCSTCSVSPSTRISHPGPSAPALPFGQRAVPHPPEPAPLSHKLLRTGTLCDHVPRCMSGAQPRARHPVVTQ